MSDEQDYPNVSQAHLALARSYCSAALSGPPLSAGVVALVQHMYTQAEAEILQHLKPLRARKAAGLARVAGRPEHEVETVLRRLAFEKYLILGFGRDKERRYTLMPIVPGTFESVMMWPSRDDLTEWHRRFAELYEAVFETGYLGDFQHKPTRAVRYIPVGEVIDSLPAALPSDRLEDILDHYDRFSIAVCQCRASRQLTGEGCGRMLETCTAFGDAAGWLVGRGKAKAASKQDVIDMKRAAEKEGLVTWMFNVGNQSRYNGSCSCCGCCCGALRAATRFGAQGVIAPPHFMPRFDMTVCTYCDKCAKACPMGAVVVTAKGEDKGLTHLPERCIGCGLCAAACPKRAAVMSEVSGYEKPPSGWPQYALKYGAASLGNIWRVRRQRKG